MSDNITISVRGVTKSFGTGTGRSAALRGVDLDIRTGEMLMLSGPSGCGKTTLISIIAGILDADDGQCRVFGCDIANASETWRSDFRRHRLGFVFQSYNLLPCLSALENVCVPLRLVGIGSADARELGLEMLDRVGLASHAHADPTLMSGGQQQRVAIARALVHRPMLVICDEPTSALDHDNGKRVMELLRDLAVRDGRSVIAVTHDPRILPYADRIARMDDGRVVGIEQAHDEPVHDDEEELVVVDSDEENVMAPGGAS